MRLVIDELEARIAFGAFVRLRRERLGWSQRDLERVTGIDQTVISRIENGLLRNTRLHQVSRLLCVLAPEILELRVRQDGTMDELATWEPVRPFAPPILAPPARNSAAARPSLPPSRPRGRQRPDGYAAEAAPEMAATNRSSP